MNARPKMIDEEVGAAMKGLRRRVHDHDLKRAVDPHLVTSERADDVEPLDAQRRRFLHEADQLRLQHRPALLSEADHHRHRGRYTVESEGERGTGITSVAGSG